MADALLTLVSPIIVGLYILITVFIVVVVECAYNDITDKDRGFVLIEKRALWIIAAVEQSART